MKIKDFSWEKRHCATDHTLPPDGWYYGSAMLALLPVLLPLGLYLPGLLIARWFRHSLWWASAFVLSLPILFHSVFWLGIFGVRLQLWTVLPLLVVLSAGVAWAQRRYPVSRKPRPSAPWTRTDGILLTSTALVVGTLAVYLVRAPLVGVDSWFRWDFLAKQILALGNFRFYPPLAPADFRAYFYVDGIPPMVSFAHWWMYASAGRPLPVLIAAFVTAQFVCTLAFVYGTAAALFSRRAGVVAAALLAASPIYFWAILVGQETGLTALAIAATIYFLVTAQQPRDVPAMVSAGLAASLCALSREYGWIALVAGIATLAWRRAPRPQILLFAAVAAAGAGPWYLRNWILAGNPFYSLRFVSFAVNPVHDAIMQFYRQLLSASNWSAKDWLTILLYFLTLAAFQMLAGIAGGIRDFRRHGYLLLTALLVAAFWLESVGYTAGGFLLSVRVLSPAIAVLSISAAGLLDGKWNRSRWQSAVVAAIVLCQVWTAAEGMIFPAPPNSIFTEGLKNAFPALGPPLEFLSRDQVVGALPPGSRVLSDNALLHAALQGSGVEVVPVWSPEVGYLFSARPEEADRRLAAAGISAVAVYPGSINLNYLTSTSPFYATLPQRWRAVTGAQSPSGAFYVLVPNRP